MSIEKVVELTNLERAKAGLPSLTPNNQLVNAAQNHSSNMLQDDFFDHTAPDGSSVSNRAKDSGYEYLLVGENIAAGQTTAEEVVQGWMNSPGHRANILNPNYTEIGVGYEYAPNDSGSVNYNHYWTQVFGTSPESDSDNIESSDLDSIEPIENLTNLTGAPDEDLVVNDTILLDQSLLTSDSTESIESENFIDPMDTSSNAINTGSEEFVIGDSSLDRSLFISDSLPKSDSDNIKSSDLDSIEPIENLTNLTGAPGEDFMVSSDSSLDRSLFISDSLLNEDLIVSSDSLLDENLAVGDSVMFFPDDMTIKQVLEPLPLGSTSDFSSSDMSSFVREVFSDLGVIQTETGMVNVSESEEYSK